jgi:hypothetical protein
MGADYQDEALFIIPLWQCRPGEEDQLLSMDKGRVI